MIELTNKELMNGYQHWHVKLNVKAKEQALEPFLSDKIKGYSANQEAWLKKTRQSLQLSAKAVANKVGVSRAAYSMYEECEQQGSISLASLARAAEAMDCELVYAIRPKSRKHFAQIIWEKLLPTCLKHPWLKNCDPKRKASALAHIAGQVMDDTNFRRKQAWSLRRLYF